MTFTNELLIEEIKEGKTINEISKELKLTHRQIYHRLLSLKNAGFDFSRKYYSDGSLVYKPIDNFYDNVPNTTSLITGNNEQKLSLAIVSDIHLGSVQQGLEEMYQVFDYCSKEKIHTILVSGDFIDGRLGPSKKLHDSYEEQIKYAIKEYPHDDNINSFLCLGNHDFDALLKSGQNLALSLNNYRHDINVLGYEKGVVYIKNDSIVLQHNLQDSAKKQGAIDIPKTSIYIKGHRHNLIVNDETPTSGFIIYTPSVSNIFLTECTDLDESVIQDEMFPTFLKMTINFEKGFFSTVRLEQFLINNNVYRLNSFVYNLANTRRGNTKNVKNEEVLPTLKVRK